MTDLFTSGRAIDVILSVVCLEVALLWWLRRLGRGLAPLDLLGLMLPGVLLLLAVRCALTGADYRWTAAFLIASLPVHLFDVFRRLARRLDDRCLPPGSPR